VATADAKMTGIKVPGPEQARAGNPAKSRKYLKQTKANDHEQQGARTSGAAQLSRGRPAMERASTSPLLLR
jgi:hypothetical protein